MNLAMNKSLQASFAKYKLGAFALVLAQTTWTNAANAQIVQSINNFSDRPPKRSLPQLSAPPSQGKPQQRSGKVSFIPPKLPFAGIPSGRARGAGGRSNCLNVNVPLTALVPVEKKPIDDGQEARLVTNVWGLTARSHPTFLFYVPYPHASAQTAEFVLQDAEDNDVYRTTINLPQTPSIVSLSLNSMSAPLKVGKMYHWYFKVRCSRQSMSGPVFVEGWVQRVELKPNVAHQISVATPYQKIALYAENGIWYDTIADLAAMRSQNFQDRALQADWQQLLQSVGLANVQSELVVAASDSNSQGEKRAGGEIINF